MQDKLKEIKEGWKGYFSGDPLTAEQERRAFICSKCPYSKYSKTLNVFVKDEYKEIEGYKCTKCDCPLSAKVRSNSSECPIGLWKSIKPKKENE